MIQKKESPLGVSDDALVIRLGFEPKTHSLEGCCSIQLSYRTSFSLKVLQRYDKETIYATNLPCFLFLTDYNK